MQPGQRGGEERGPDRARRSGPGKEQPERDRERQGGGHLGVDLEGVERDRRHQGKSPGQQRGLVVVAREPARRLPHLQGEPGRGQGQRDHAERPATQSVERREEQGQTRAVRGIGPSIRAGRPVVRRDRARRVLAPVLPRVVVAEIEVVLPPEALGHQQVVRLVAGDAQAQRVGEPDDEQ